MPQAISDSSSIALRTGTPREIGCFVMSPERCRSARLVSHIDRIVGNPAVLEHILQPHAP